jgi:hypothetical protein
MVETVAGAFTPSASISITPQLVSNVRVYIFLAKYFEGASGAIGIRGAAVAGSQNEEAAALALELIEGLAVGVGPTSSGSGSLEHPLTRTKPMVRAIARLKNVPRVIVEFMASF